jgi:putative two-component system response regulator
MQTTKKTVLNTKPRILIVDDEADIRQVVTLVLQEAGYSVSTAESTESARILLKKEHYDAVVTDVKMPGEDGISLLSMIHQEYPETPVVLMTAYAQLQMAIDAIKNGAFDFIQKPFDMALLNSVVDKAVSHSKQQCMEKSRRAVLEDALAARTTELENAKVELDFAHSKILKAVTCRSQQKNTSPDENRTPETIFKIFSRVV